MVRLLALFAAIVLTLCCASQAWCEANVWQGRSATASTAWSAADNWSLAAVPTATDGRDVVIPAGAKAYPALQADAAAGGSVTVERGASLKLAGHQLALAGSGGVRNAGTLDATGDGARIATGQGGFINTGTIQGAPALTFSACTRETPLTGGGAQLASLTLAASQADGIVTQTDAITLTGDLVVQGAQFRLGRVARLIVNGALEVTGGQITMEKGGEVWLGVTRQGDRVIDVALKLSTPITPDLCPAITGYDIGPAIPDTVPLLNIAPYADVASVPYTTMLRNRLIDPDPQLRTLVEPESGLPTKAVRFTFRFAKPQQIAAIRWAVAGGKWALLADTTGKGTYDRVLRMDLRGKLENPGGVWKSAQWVNNTFWPAVKVYGIQLVNPSGPLYLFDVQLLAPQKTVTLNMAPPSLARGVPEVKSGKPATVEAPTVDQRFTQGFHIEPWMIDIQGWLKTNPRPPLAEYPPFMKFVADLKRLHANYVNMWPPKDFATQGPGTYESNLLWPSQYDRHSISVNALQAISEAFKKNGITFFVMDRVPYPKELKDMPASPTRDQDAPYVTRQEREYLDGVVKEEVAAGAAGVGVGFDEQYYNLKLPSQVDEFTRKTFEARYGCKVPDQPADTESFRKWVLFSYEEFAKYLGDAAAVAKQANPDVITNSPITVLDNAWNDRWRHGVAHDIVGHTADIDFLRASGYQSFSKLGNYVTAYNVKRAEGMTKQRGAISLHNCPWANDPATFPGYYRYFSPVLMYGPPISAIINGADAAAYWRYNFIYYGGYDKYVEEAYSFIDTLAAWGAKAAYTPPTIAVLVSRASEDWWQIKQAFGQDGDPMDQTRAYHYTDWVMEMLLRRGYPFEVFSLDHPEDLAELANYPLVIMPFPYSMSKEAAALVANAQTSGSKILVLGRQGEADEYGAPYPRPLLADAIAGRKFSTFDDDIVRVGQYQEVQDRFCRQLDKLLGAENPLYVNTYGNDVEVTVRERGLLGKLVCLINWTDRPVTVDVGLTKMMAGQYEMLQRDLQGATEVTINGKSSIDGKTLRRMRVPLAPEEVKVLFIHPFGGCPCNSGETASPGK